MKSTDCVSALAGAWAMRPWVGGSAGACEHPADDDADDLDFVGPCVDPDGPVLAAPALGAELERRRVDAVHPSEHHVVSDACGDARELERAVRRALRAKDRAALAEIYRKLCRSELPNLAVRRPHPAAHRPRGHGAGPVERCAGGARASELSVVSRAMFCRW